MADGPTLTRQLARDEVERHQKRFLGITATAPQLKEVDGALQYCVDVRVGANPTWAVVRDCLVATWALGVVSDVGVPVVCERSEAGQITVIARSVVRLPDLSLTTYSHADLGLVFMTLLEEDEAGVWRDGFGHAMPDPTALTGAQSTYTWDSALIPFGSDAFTFGTTPLGATDAGWTET